jgi:hypothetical protein
VGTYATSGSDPWYVEFYLNAGTKNYFCMYKYQNGEGNIPCQYSIKVTYLKPDLRIEEVEPDSVCVGSTVDFSVTVRNSGGDMVKGESFVVTMAIEGTDIAYSTDCTTSLDKNKRTVINFTEIDGLNLRSLPKGKHKITITVDDKNNIDETNEVNNTLIKDFYVEDYGNNKESATPIELGKKISGEMDYRYDYDYFAFTPDSDGNYVATLSNTENMCIRLRDNTGTSLKYITSKPLTLNYDLVAGNTYYFELSQNSNYLTEDYDFIVTKDDYGNDMNSAKAIKSGDKFNGKMDYNGDVDYF